MYYYWMLAVLRVSDQLDSGQEEEEKKEVEGEGKEVKQRVPATTTVPESPLVPVDKKKYLVHGHVRGILRAVAEGVQIRW